MTELIKDTDSNAVKYDAGGESQLPAEINKQHITISDSDVGMRLDRVMSKHLPSYSRTEIQSWIKSGKVLVDNSIYNQRYQVSVGQRITVEIPTPQVLPDKGQPIPLQIRYQDSSLLIVAKPAGLIVHPGAGCDSGTLLNSLLYHLPSLAKLPRAGIVHRLDQYTSGLLLVAKDKITRLRLIEMLKKHAIRREYLALVCGIVRFSGSINQPIGRHPRIRTRMAINPHGKSAVTHYRVLERMRHHSLLKVRLKTGRTHQIRVHLTSIGHPILGDHVYGKRIANQTAYKWHTNIPLDDFNRTALHAASLSFTHPESGQLIAIDEKLPADYQSILQKLRELESMS